MLSPDALQDAGDAVAAIYSDMEAKMLEHLVDTLIGTDKLGQKSMTELNLLAQSMTSDLRRIVEENREAIADGVYETCEKLLSASDRDDAKRLQVSNVTFPHQLAATVTGLQQVLDRDNLKMVEGAKQAFLKASVEAVTMTNSGLFTSEQAVHKAVRNLTSGGIGVTEVTYKDPKDGFITVTNKVDVAVRRHVRTQIAQDSGRMTLDRLQELDVALVEVSSHEGSRPSHAEWQGRCYSLKGDVVIDGKRYPDFYSSTHYGDVDGLLGANCRHSFGPYRHGAPRSYKPNPQHPSGLSNDEVYKLTQGQRYRERQIRAAKRDIMGAQRIYEKEPTLPNKTNLIQARERLKRSQASMRQFIEDANAKCKPGTTVLHRNPRREWAGDMPKGVKTNARIRAMATDRNLAAGYRTSPKRLLTEKEISRVAEDAASIGIPAGILRFNEGDRTGFSDLLGAITVRGDILPDLASNNNRDTMTSRAVLAHEYYGHYKHRNTKLFPGDWRDEFRASYRAAIDAPGLTIEERASLMVDAYDRASEAGHILRKTAEYRKIVYGHPK